MIAQTNSLATEAEDIGLKPLWLRIGPAERISGISRSKLYELMKDGVIRHASLRGEGQKKATRLINRESLLGYIESHATGGVESPATGDLEALQPGGRKPQGQQSGSLATGDASQN